MIKQLLLFTLFLGVFLGGCSQEKQQHTTLKITTNTWIGYLPLFYADAKGELQKNNIKLIYNVSLAESVEVYIRGNADLITATQHEHFILNKSKHKVLPYILLDRSYGGDIILANTSEKQLLQSDKIYAYLEIDSINADVLKDYIKMKKIPQQKFIYKNLDQENIALLQNNPNKTLLAVTYSPYDIQLKQNGFQEITSTKNLNSIMVIDAIFGEEKFIHTNKQQLLALKKIVDDAVVQIQQHPKEVYPLVKSYLNDISFQEFEDALEKIQWINNPNQQLLQKIETLPVNTQGLLQ